jgi:hypothetical protein
MLNADCSIEEINIEWIHVVTNNIRSILLQMLGDQAYIKSNNGCINMIIINWFKNKGIFIEPTYYEFDVKNGQIIYMHKYHVSDDTDGLLLHFINVIQSDPNMKISPPACQQILLSMTNFNLDKYITNYSALMTTIECLNSDIIFPSLTCNCNIFVDVPIELILGIGNLA